MKLYYAPGTCALSSHIVLCEAGLEHSLEKVDLRDKKIAGDIDYRLINPKGYVPALQLNDGTVLTENGVVLQYLADLVPEKKLAPAMNTMARYRLMETLSFLSTELHKGFSPLFNSAISDANREAAISALMPRLALVAKQLGNSNYLFGDQFTVADAYLFVILSWADYIKLSLAEWPALKAFQARVAARPAVQEALKAEGLIKT